LRKAFFQYTNSILEEYFMTDSNLLVTLSNAMADAVEKAGAATVLVNARPRFPASGVAYAPDLILTTNHGVEREEDITVLLPDGTEVSAALAGRDPATDLALLRLSKASAVPAELAAKEARVGQIVLALGRPGVEGIQASQGIVSSVGGPLRTGRASLLERFIRTDAIPYPGFSGGPLIDLDGKVLGINTSGFGPGTSLTIPGALAWQMAETLRNQGRVRRGYLGVRTQVVDLPASLQSKLGRSQEHGLMLVSLEADSPAEKSGLIVGDILVGAEGKPMQDHDELMARLASGTTGKTLTFEILRGGELKSQAVVVGER
jgi:S1-C subfamily serine protease